MEYQWFRAMELTSYQCSTFLKVTGSVQSYTIMAPCNLQTKTKISIALYVGGNKTDFVREQTAFVKWPEHVCLIQEMLQRQNKHWPRDSSFAWWLWNALHQQCPKLAAAEVSGACVGQYKTSLQDEAKNEKKWAHANLDSLAFQIQRANPVLRSISNWSSMSHKMAEVWWWWRCNIPKINANGRNVLLGERVIAKSKDERRLSNRFVTNHNKLDQSILIVRRLKELVGIVENKTLDNCYHNHHRRPYWKLCKLDCRWRSGKKKWAMCFAVRVVIQREVRWNKKHFFDRTKNDGVMTHHRKIDVWRI